MSFNLYLNKAIFAVGCSALISLLGAQTAIAKESGANKAEKTTDTKPETKRKAPKMKPGIVTVNMKTNMGDIVIELNKEKAPKTVDNFVQYATDKFFDKTIFHRVMNGFMIQGGGFTENMVQKPTRSPIENEGKNGLSNERGTLAMARTNDPDSATSQFFINLVNNEFLNTSPSNAGYAVFGQVTQGMDVVDKMAAVKTANAGMHANVPVKPIVIESVSVQQ
jgi:peptidyl-prolyl cis-trans isomerase A (cyclophilin A)